MSNTIVQGSANVAGPKQFWRKINIRSLGLTGILIAVWRVFQFMTDGLFLTPRNLTNLSGQVSITAILVCGIVLIMIPGFIDLSIGASVAMCTVVGAMASAKLGLPAYQSFLITCGVGAVIGFWHGIWVAYLRVPAFIVTLGSLLAVRGLTLAITSGETFAPNPDILVISDYTFPNLFTACLAVIATSAIGLFQYREYQARRGAALSPSLLRLVIVPVGLAVALSIGGILITASYRGLPLPLFILIVVLSISVFVLKATSFGRRLYAIGSNPFAAEIAGINIALQTFIVFLTMGVLYGVAGMVGLARLASAPPGGFVGLELNVIAAAVVVGTSLFGGRGTLGGALLGALLMESLNNGMSLMNLPSSYQAIVAGMVLLFAVFFDMRSGRGSQR